MSRAAARVSRIRRSLISGTDFLLLPDCRRSRLRPGLVRHHRRQSGRTRLHHAACWAERLRSQIDGARDAPRAGICGRGPVRPDGALDHRLAGRLPRDRLVPCFVNRV